MVNVMAVSMSKGKAKDKVREVLDGFGRRVGKDTWQFYSTYKILDKIIKELNSITEEDMSVAIHVNNKQKRIKKIYEIIGNDVYEETGVPVKYSENIHEQLMESEKEILKYACLFHDLGKNDNYFQKKIRDKKNNHKISMIRHELLSFMMLDYFCKKEKTSLSRFYETLVEEIKTKKKKSCKIKADEIMEVFTELYQKVIKNGESENGLNYMRLLKMLILTHHRQFCSKGFGVEEVICEYLPYLSKRNDEKYEKERDFFLKEFKKNLVNVKEFSDLFRKDVIEEFLKRKEHLSDNLTDKKEFVKKYLFLRTCMMLADHYASSLKIEKDKNLMDTDSNYTVANPYQLLETHLKLVAEQSQGVYSFFKKDSKVNLLKNIKLPKSEKEAYKWQEESLKIIGGADLIFNLAATGSGKTFGNLKMALKLGAGSVSVSYPLRSLTIQTGEAYMEHFSETAVVVGENELSGENKGGNLEDIVEDAEKSEGKEIVNDKIYMYKKNHKAIEHVFREKENYEAFFNSNLTVSTIDYVVKSVKNSRSKFLLSLSKFFKTDLFIIDELDNLGLEDIIFTMKFIFLCGLFNKKIIISSASINKIHAALIMKMYSLGKRDKFKAVFVDEDVKETDKKDERVFLINEKNSKIDDIEKEIGERYYKKRYNKLEDKESKAAIVKFKYVGVLNDNEENMAAKQLFENIMKVKRNFERLHKKYDTPQIGLIKFYSINQMVKYLKKFVEYLEKEGNEKYKKRYKKGRIFIIPFHSQQYHGYKVRVEEFMKKALNRHDKKYQEYLNKEIEKEFGVKLNKDDVIIMFTTTIIDTGKDVDFDWGGTEMVNVSNLMQTGGRINRHRRIPLQRDNYNLFVFSLSSKESINKPIYVKKEQLYNEFKNLSLFSKLLKSNFFQEEIKVLKNKMYAEEANLLIKEMISQNKENEALNIFLTANFEKEIIFRRKNGINTAVKYNEANGTIDKNIPKDEDFDFFDKYLLIKDKKEHFKKDFINFTYYKNNKTISKKQQDEKYRYHPILGIYRTYSVL